MKQAMMWAQEGAMNSLVEVYQHYCQGRLDKDPRDTFVKGTMADVRKNFQVEEDSMKLTLEYTARW